MTLIEEKKLVAKKLMQWMFFRDWNPQTDRNCWPEIWKKLESIKIDKYHDLSDKYYANLGEISAWELHTSKPETCWKALIKTIK